MIVKGSQKISIDFILCAESNGEKNFFMTMKNGNSGEEFLAQKKIEGKEV